MVQITLLVSRRCGPVRSQQVFHLPDGQDRDKLFDLCSLLKLVCCGTQHPFNLGYWPRELFTQILYNALPLYWLALERHPYFRQICT
jgi:hypothetical protein